MTYDEFRNTYSWMMKKYPDTYYFCSKFDDIVGKMTKVTYTKSGSRWKEMSRNEEEITGRNYCNCVDAVPFFRGIGGTERIEMGYTYYGYIPTVISSIAPDKMTKIVRSFMFYK